MPATLAAIGAGLLAAAGVAAAFVSGARKPERAKPTLRRKRW